MLSTNIVGPFHYVGVAYKAGLPAGLEHEQYRFHDLRHSTITTTERYAPPNLESKRKAFATPASDPL